MLVPRAGERKKLKALPNLKKRPWLKVCLPQVKVRVKYNTSQAAYRR